MGTGRSISDLSAGDVAAVNRGRNVLAINKYMAFYRMGGIVPTHVYFVDSYDESSVRFLNHTLNVCREDGLRGLTFILNRRFQKRVATSAFDYWLKFLAVRVLRRSDRTVFAGPPDSRFEFINHEHSLEGKNWADDLAETLFHFRGSLSTVLNYVSIRFPGRKVKLVGVDFNSPGYFFQDELDKLTFEWRDWTTDIVKEKKMHFSAVDHDGKTIFDRFDFILENLAASGNKLVCCNENSLLVEKGFTPFEPVRTS